MRTHIAHCRRRRRRRCGVPVALGKPALYMYHSQVYRFFGSPDFVQTCTAHPPGSLSPAIMHYK
jgi:hypothetical protein